MIARATPFALVLSAWSLVCPHVARAESRDPAAADALFQQGREAMKKGDLARACSSFAESERLDPAAGTLLNLADCEEKAGKLASALAHVHAALDLLPVNDERVALARSRIAGLDRRVPRLTVTLAPGAPRGTRVTRGEIELGAASLGVSLPVDPGTIAVIASAPRQASRRFEVSIAAGQAKTLSVEPGPPAKEPPGSLSPSSRAPDQTRRDEPAEASADGRHRQLAGWVLVGVGAIGIGVGVAAVGRRQSELDAAASRCPDDPSTGRAACTSNDTATAAENATAFHDDLAAATRWKTVATVGFVGGAAAAIGGVVLLLARPSTQSTGLRVTPAFAGSAPAGVAVSGAW